jgi:hypothetical protein
VDLRPRVSNLASKRGQWQESSRSGSIREYPLIQSTMTCSCDIVHPSFPLKCMYAFLYINCLCMMLCSQVINCFPQENGKRLLGWQRRRGEISTSQWLEIRLFSRLSHPKRFLCLQMTDISMLVPCMRVCIAVSPLARRYASKV